MSLPAIRRRFADCAFGQVHYREAGISGDRRIVLFHASPGSSKQLEALIARLARHAHVIAPDTPGNGDTPACHAAPPDIADLAAAQRALLDALGVDRAALYGTHTGACIAAELAIAAPERVSSLVLDGIGAWDEATTAELLTRYAHPFAPDLDGAYLQRAFTFCRDQFFFFPWYARDRAHRRDGGLAGAEALHAWVLEVLKAATSYQHNYHAAFRWPARDRLPLLPGHTLALAAANDPLLDMTRSAARSIPAAQFRAMPRSDDPDYVTELTSAIVGFAGYD